MYFYMQHLLFALPLVGSAFASPVIQRDASPSAIAGGAVTAAAPTATSSFVPGPKLLPAVHWEQNLSDINSLAPTNSSNLYYSINGTADPTLQHLFANVSATFQYQAVVLNHTNLVKSVSCSPNGILVSFTGPDPYDYAVKTWPASDDFVLVTYTSGCGNATNQRTFWLVDNIKPQNGSNAVLATIKQELAIENALDEVELFWGTYHPDSDANSTAVAEKRGNVGGGGVEISKRFDKDVTKTADINIAAPTNAASPWGEAALLFTEQVTAPKNSTLGSLGGGTVSGSVSVYCVDCSFHSHVVVLGHAKWSWHSVKPEILTAEVIASDISAEMQLGLVAGAKWSITKDIQLLNEPIPDLGFSLDGLADIGAWVTIDASAGLEIDATGSLLMGTSMTAPSGFTGSLDIIDNGSDPSTNPGNNSGSSVTPFSPQWSAMPTKYQGQLSATVTLGLPIGLHLGIKIKGIDFDKEVALIEKPSISGTVAVAGGNNGNSTTISGCNDGLGWKIDAHNDISLNLFNIKTFDLEHYDSPDIAHGCVKF